MHHVTLVHACGRRPACECANLCPHRLWRGTSKMMLRIGLSIAVLASAALAEDFSKVKVEAHPVADKVWYLTGEGGNIGVLAGDDGVVLIDDQFAPLSAKIRAAVKK